MVRYTKELNSKCTVREVLTVSYVQNNYITAQDFGITVRRHGLMYTIDGNFWLSKALPINLSDTVQIATIQNYSAAKTIRLQIPHIDVGLALLLIIYDNGIIRIGGSTVQSTPQGWYRFHAIEAFGTHNYQHEFR